MKRPLPFEAWTTVFFVLLYPNFPITNSSRFGRKHRPHLEQFTTIRFIFLWDIQKKKTETIASVFIQVYKSTIYLNLCNFFTNHHLCTPIYHYNLV